MNPESATQDWAAKCAEIAALRFDEYMAEIGKLLSPAVAEAVLDELTVVASSMAMEMFTLGRSACRQQPNRN